MLWRATIETTINTVSNGKFSEEELLTETVFRYSVNQGKLNPVEE